jgi:virginiamycin B lyase
MSEQQQFLQTQPREFEHSETSSVPTTTPSLAHRLERFSRRPRQRRRRVWFLPGIILLSLIALLAFSSKGIGKQGQSPATSHTPLSTQLGTGMFRTFPFPRSDSQVMRPALDHHGRVWFGDMGHNALVVFDPQTQSFQYLTPPQGHSGIMGIQIASDDTIWFAEQFANYIGHYFPTTDQYQIYSLPWLTVPDPAHPGQTRRLPSAPNELALDPQGQIWFTEFNADRLGRLDPSTGLIQHYPLAAQTSIQTLYPYGITLGSHGQVWFTESGTNHIGRLNPTTGTIRLFTIPDSQTLPMEIASDPQGNIWTTTFTPDLLLRLTPNTTTFTTFPIPPQSNTSGALYGLLITPTNQIWLTMLEENTLAHLDPTTQHLTLYHIPTPNSQPLGLVMDTNHTLWFTGLNAVGMLRAEGE